LFLSAGFCCSDAAPGVYLVKWWREDNRWGKSSLLNITPVEARILLPQDASIPIDFQIKQEKEREKEFGKPRKRKALDLSRKPIVRFQERGTPADLAIGMPGMCGDASGSVPRALTAAASGIGGTAALETDEDTLVPGTSSSTLAASPHIYTHTRTHARFHILDCSSALTLTNDDYYCCLFLNASRIAGTRISDTYLSKNSLEAALCNAGVACRAVDIVFSNTNTNVFVCARPPGHHAGRYGLTSGCMSTGFCLLNNAAIAAVYAR